MQKLKSTHKIEIGGGRCFVVKPVLGQITLDDDDIFFCNCKAGGILFHPCV